MKKLKEIQVVIDDFRIDVIKAILSAYPGRAVDDGDPSNDTFLIDGIPVRIEADRIVVGDDLDNYIPLKNAPVAGQPPRYRDVDSILMDFSAYINKEKKEGHMKFTIKEETQIPGTSIVLEKGDKIIYKEAKMFTGSVAALLRALEAEGWDMDVYEDYVECLMGNLLVVVNDDGNVSVTDRYDRYGAMIKTNVKAFARDYGKIIDKYLKPKYDHMDYRYKAPSELVLESTSRKKEATEVFKKSFLKHPGDMWYTKDKYWGVYWDKDDPSVIWIYHTDDWREDYYEIEDLDYNGVSQIVFKGQVSYSVKESVKVKESTVSDIEKILKKTGWDIEETDDDFLLAQYGDEVFSINADSGEISIGTDEGSEVIWTGSYDDFIKTYKGVKDNKIIVDNKSFKAVTESIKRMEESMSSNF